MTNSGCNAFCRVIKIVDVTTKLDYHELSDYPIFLFDSIPNMRQLCLQISHSLFSSSIIFCTPFPCLVLTILYMFILYLYCIVYCNILRIFIYINILISSLFVYVSSIFMEFPVAPDTFPSTQGWQLHRNLLTFRGHLQRWPRLGEDVEDTAVLVGRRWTNDPHQLQCPIQYVYCIFSDGYGYLWLLVISN